jgi:hypothetical protein
MDSGCDDACEQSLNNGNLLHLNGGISSVMCAMVDLFFIFNVLYVLCHLCCTGGHCQPEGEETINRE